MILTQVTFSMSTDSNYLGYRASLSQKKPTAPSILNKGYIMHASAALVRPYKMGPQLIAPLHTPSFLNLIFLLGATTSRARKMQSANALR